MTSNELRRVLQFAYCLDYDRYLEIFNIPDNYYAKGKFEEMQKNFSGWYCNLDSSNANLFVNAVLNRS